MRMLTVLAVTTLVLHVQAASAQQRPRWVYAVKVVCGTPSPVLSGVVQQRYQTTVNVVADSDTAFVTKKFLRLLPPGGDHVMGPPVQLDTLTMQPFFGFAAECVEIQTKLKQPVFADGYLFITSTSRLIVDAVYSVPGGVNVMRIPGRMQSQLP